MLVHADTQVHRRPPSIGRVLWRTLLTLKRFEMKMDSHGSQETLFILSFTVRTLCSRLNCEVIRHHDEAAALLLNHIVILQYDLFKRSHVFCNLNREDQ